MSYKYYVLYSGVIKAKTELNAHHKPYKRFGTPLSNMVLSQLRSNRKPSGSRYKNVRSKKLSEKGMNPVFTKLEPLKTRSIKGRGSTSKLKALCVDVANVYDPKDKKYKKTKLLTVVQNPANTNYVRRNIITKGTIVQTELGNARITNRPSQEGCVNAVLV